jgi:acyl carrier protein
MDARELIEDTVRKGSLACSDDTLLADIEGWDSLKAVRLVLRLQEILGRELSEDDIGGLQSISDVVRLLRSGADDGDE